MPPPWPRVKRVNEQQRHDEDYLAQFSQQKGVKQSAMGFWYRVDYAGEGALAPTAVVDVVVKEKLTDGTVIQDMELSGKVLSQPLSVSAAVQGGDKPSAQPRFADDGRAAGAGVRRNRLPAEVPPNATMIYELRIDNSQAPTKGPRRLNGKPERREGRDEHHDKNRAI